MTEQLLRNPGRSRAPGSAFASTRDALEFHRIVPGYAPTRLHESRALADALGVGRVFVKVESNRFGLPAFKMLGASWAVFRTIVNRLSRESQWLEPQWLSFDTFATAAAPLRPLTLVTATDGNHGRAVARVARLLGFSARIFVPDDMAAARRDAIEGEGAELEVVDGSYDDAVVRSAAAASERSIVISDTSWPGYETIPSLVIDGYSTIFAEVDDELTARQAAQPDIVFLPAGVGALAAAGAARYAHSDATVVTVEPTDAACVLESCRAEQPVTVPGPHRSCMVGLNCGTASPIALPILQARVDWCVAVADGRAERGMRLLAADGIVAGETGAASLAGALGVVELGGRGLVGMESEATVLLIVTEGATDPVNYERIVGRPPDK